MTPAKVQRPSLPRRTTPQSSGGPDALIPLPSLVCTLLLRNHMSYRSYKSKRANSARSGKTDAETDGMSRGPTQNVSARRGPMHNSPPQRANAPDAHARKDRCQNRPHVQRTNTMRSLGKNRCTTSIRLKGQTRQARKLGKTDAKTDHTSRGPTQCVRSARTDARLPMCSLGKNRCTTPNVFARQEPMHNSKKERN